MKVLAFAWRSLVRQPARSTLGVLGVAAVGALLLDMLLLSQGLLVSMRDLLDRTGYDVRVTSTGELPRNGPRIPNTTEVLAALASLPEIRSALALRFADAEFDAAGGTTIAASFQGVSRTPTPPWTVLQGRDIRGPAEIVISSTVRDAIGASLDEEVVLRASCGEGTQSLPPARLRVVGIAEFPFELTNEHTIGGTLDTLATACGAAGSHESDLLLVTSQGSADAAAAAIQRQRPELSAFTNEQMLGRIQQTGFTYFRQISTVLTTVTVTFALLLITVLLTVSVNQRLGEIAALRALGLSRTRMVADILCESALIVSIGGLISLPLGAVLATWLDRILTRMPGIPAELHFFVFEPNAIVIHVSLLAMTAVLAALYPMRIVATLPIAATLRDEVIG